MSVIPTGNYHRNRKAVMAGLRDLLSQYRLQTEEQLRQIESAISDMEKDCGLDPRHAKGTPKLRKKLPPMMVWAFQGGKWKLVFQNKQAGELADRVKSR